MSSTLMVWCCEFQVVVYENLERCNLSSVQSVSYLLGTGMSFSFVVVFCGTWLRVEEVSFCRLLDFTWKSVQ